MFVAATVLALGYDAMMCWKCVLYYSGRLGCGRHGLTVCGACCVDYTFMDEVNEDSPGELDRVSDQEDTVLRAVLAALRFRNWPGEGFTKLVIATDSDNREAAKNRDLWQALLGEFERLEELGLRVEFWKIPTGLNRELKKAAKRAVEDEEKRNYCDVVGALV
ncbi:hypothetical protein CEP52_010383 [Fusarium oligoseptatum]|uniref:RNase H type-1 domain-containing protein n=1 Tax=Fusarium oligoseptatum TaxID=2604345 RepID=A0A428T8H8_9HYPO|nr:hypothetical protein CEP52_010383 [Fusarium oligoseptatum]